MEWLVLSYAILALQGMLKKAASLRQRYGRQASGVFGGREA